ncbi:prephenate dehydratase [Kordiimonas aquimaris]|uniref:prephenate dehydratase n=1 Tax=Kordiimonas aquimaris TaxID=707591 RepID=UPI0021D2A7DA|nr:prephenate dehydratase [Kordiimonas aquimaris]
MPNQQDMLSSEDTSDTSENTIAFQGELGAYSHMACRAVYPDMHVLPCPSFEDALAAVQKGNAKLAMIPIENSTAGRVADIHILLPGSGLFIIGEHFETIRHCLLATHNADDTTLKRVTSHVQALGQCRKNLRAMGLVREPFADTAGSARYVADLGDNTIAGIASELAAEVYDLKIIKRDLQDEGNNTTRFVVLSQEALHQDTYNDSVMTSFTFEVRNIPAALYKALGGFATNSVNMTKLESYYESDSFKVSEFYADIEGHEGMENVARAMEELRFHTKHVNLLGTYPIARKRSKY